MTQGEEGNGNDETPSRAAKHRPGGKNTIFVFVLRCRENPEKRNFKARNPFAARPAVGFGDYCADGEKTDDGSSTLRISSWRPREPFTLMVEVPPRRCTCYYDQLLVVTKVATAGRTTDHRIARLEPFPGTRPIPALRRLEAPARERSPTENE